jgi:hypothetical protein
MADERPDEFSANGTYPEAAIGIADPAPPDAPASDDELASLEIPAEATAADQPTDEAVTESFDQGEAAAPDDGTNFLAQLAGAMRATAATERTRIDEDINRRREAHLETIRGRRDSEAEKMRELAAEDLKAIDDWAAGERQRIDEEREQRAAALQDDLDKSLAEHGSQIDAEIEGVEGAIAGYRTEVEAFFARLDAEMDPVEMARLAGQQPPFPDLAVVAPVQVTAPVAAETGQAAVGVMAPDAAADPAAAWAQWNATTAPAESAEATDSPVAGEAQPATSEAPSSLFQSVAVSRPYANLIGDRSDER